MGLLASTLSVPLRAGARLMLAPHRRAAADPARAQTERLRTMLTTAAETEWGRRFGFRDLAASADVVAAYQAAVPLSTYEDIREDAARVRSGASDVMWPGTVHDFAVSSGTTSEGKIIPVSEETLDHNRRYSLAMMHQYLVSGGSPAFLGGRFVSLPGLTEPDPKRDGVRIGEVSGLVARHAPAWVDRLYQAVPADILNMPTWESKLDAIAEAIVDQDVRTVAIVPTWSLVLYDRVIQLHARKTGKGTRTLREVWPNLQVYFSGGVALASYRRLLNEIVGDDRVDYIEGYGASEGFFSFSSQPNSSDMQLYLAGGVFFEFVPLEDLGSETTRRYWVDTVETDVRYALYVTSTSGLWSYDVGDVIKFTRRDPPHIEVAGRTSEMLDRYGEAVFGEEARAAVRVACKATGARIKDFHVTSSEPDRGHLPGHQWLVEFEVKPDDPAEFAAAIDRYLRQVNRHYAIRRDSDTFGPPTLEILPKGTFRAWLKATRSRVSAQTKVPRMSEDRSAAEGILMAAAR